MSGRENWSVSAGGSLNITRFVFLVLLALQCTACAFTRPADSTLTCKAEVSEPSRVRFSGAGAGAGIMLSSTMGPMGLAVGVAIDEGIAGEIDQTFRSAGGDIQQIFDDVLDELCAKSVDFRGGANGDLADGTTVVGTLDHYGFKSVGGDQGAVAPSIAGSLQRGEERLEFRHVAEQSAPELRATLEELKSDGGVTAKLLRAALESALEQALAD